MIPSPSDIDVAVCVLGFRATPVSPLLSLNATVQFRRPFLIRLLRCNWASPTEKKCDCPIQFTPMVRFISLAQAQIQPRLRSILPRLLLCFFLRWSISTEVRIGALPGQGGSTAEARTETYLRGGLPFSPYVSQVIDEPSDTYPKAC